MTKGLAYWIAVLIVANTCLAFSIVYLKQKARTSHIELSQLRQIIDDLDIEWGRLQLEEAALSEYGRIERIATDRLGMKLPASADIILVREQ